MKKIENKQVKDNSNFIKSYFALIATCLNVPQKTGMDIIEMRKRIKILDKILDKNAALPSADFEDFEVKIIKSCVADMRWIVVDKEIVNFVDYIESV